MYIYYIATGTIYFQLSGHTTTAPSLRGETLQYPTLTGSNILDTRSQLIFMDKMLTFGYIRWRNHTQNTTAHAESASMTSDKLNYNIRPLSFTKPLRVFKSNIATK